MSASAAIAAPSPRAGAWSPEEDAILRANYVKLGAARVAEMLGRTFYPVCHRARRLNLARRRRWTASDDRRLSMLWGDLSLKGIAMSLKRSQGACITRAVTLGFDRGVQPGTATLTSEARRTGYHRQTLQSILAWAAIEAQPRMSARKKSQTQRPGVYESDLVDDAVARWLASEVVSQAADRRGVSRRVLIRALAAVGVFQPPRTLKGLWWRVPTETVDRVVGARMESERIAEVADRLGITRDTVSKMLRKAGIVPPGGRRCWRVTRAAVEKVIADLGPERWKQIKTNSRRRRAAERRKRAALRLAARGEMRCP